ncbi:Tricarboxylate/iron carrier [Radiomyces spectabilis]|uniref:Tricarboxylate/iron carrier n=1 Tax=Radiomyces spectabilis TaxID=64574 RepID=UPI00221F2806|nr:Tricarboxylate/iron carrier [Radiomyces spectabilis]KAI8366089.1 Tricarboxylate/iron carrier [Radiomyces spectabilis]
MSNAVYCHQVKLMAEALGSNLFVTRNQLERAKDMLTQYKKTHHTDNVEELWKAKLAVDSTIHPDTGEPIFLPFRMACFVPTNMVLVAGMLMPNPSIKTILFWQWANQSVNVAFNSANANKTTPMSLKETGVAYVSAVTTSCALAVGLTQGVPRLNVSASMKRLMMKLVPFTAVAAAGTVNIFLMRGKEVRDGINVYTADGEMVGKSKTAGLTAVSQVAISRILTNAPVLIVPPFLLDRLQKTAFVQARPKLVVPLNFGLIALSLMTALPAAIALFPQQGAMETAAMEKEFQNLNDKDGHPIRTLYYNKGL